MKIAILTLPLHTNYGGILQAYALQTVLERMGHTVEVLQKKDGLNHPLWMMPLIYVRRFGIKLLKDKNMTVFAEQKHARENPVIRQHTNRFIKTHIHLREIKSLDEVGANDYDALVVGSDQIWRKNYFVWMWAANMADAFLRFTQGWQIKRLSYAASFGISEWNEYSPSDTTECSKYAKLFNGISVREDDAVELCDKYLGVAAHHHVDPTLLLNKTDYQKLIPNASKSNQRVLFTYILDPSPMKDEIVNKIANIQNLTTVVGNGRVDEQNLDVEKRIQPPLENWLQGFNDAEFVVTDSFHACVFSIIFQKPFLVIGNPERGMSRFTSLLKMFGLEDRLVSSSKSLPANLFDIDFKSAETKLESLRKESLEYLSKTLN